MSNIKCGVNGLGVTRRRQKRQESSRTRLDKLAKEHLWRLEAWHGMCGFMLVHVDCLVVAMALKASMVVLEWCSCWIIHGDGFFWRLGIFPQWGFPKVYLVSHFCGCVVYSLACGFQLHICFRSIIGYVDILSFKFPYKWYQSYGFINVTLD